MKEVPHEALEVLCESGRLHAPPMESSSPAGDVCRQFGVREITFFVWKNKLFT